jgi:hypothetical protein
MLICLEILTLSGDFYFLLSAVHHHQPPSPSGLVRVVEAAVVPAVPAKETPARIETLSEEQQGNNNNNNNNKDRVLAVLAQAGITVRPEIAAKLPTWKQVTDQYGSQPVVAGLDRCETFRQTVPAVQRMIGAAGMFSTGTNLLTVLLKQNCVIPARLGLYGANATKEQLGMRWQVPWGKRESVLPCKLLLTLFSS